MILVDTSVWIDHLRQGDSSLKQLLAQAQVMCHPMVVGELACGNLKSRSMVLALLADLPSASVASEAEVLGFIQAQSLFGLGIGYVDVHLCASAKLHGVHLWTRDKRLQAAAVRLGLAYALERH
ncbi:MAG: type II toxin-antitoxin system VapC family toxin [Betaproteobacteria bacterium]|nr:type II toxin-antitoxin system VapC family toxin [Betaproteobacteria bacterium]NBY33195.1 type II toxin-antitoxin system VapC family toxin [Betaproteobacteria bacterium]NDF04853.1 type II toxin-antitoxin system VapC family toxin [Betaproteobacteria bacterium]